MTKRKTSLGRRKIEIKKINNMNSRQVTFSKRRIGLFKKASELCILTGAQVAIIVHSLGNHVFSFGHPSVESVINRYINGGTSSGNPDLSALQHKQQYAAVKQELDAEKKREMMITRAKQQVNVGNFWWNEPIDNLGLEELEQYSVALQELKKNVMRRVDELMLLESSSAPFAINLNPGIAAPNNNYFANYGIDQCPNIPYNYMVCKDSTFGNGHV